MAYDKEKHRRMALRRDIGNRRISSEPVLPSSSRAVWQFCRSCSGGSALGHGLTPQHTDRPELICQCLILSMRVIGHVVPYGASGIRLALKKPHV